MFIIGDDTKVDGVADIDCIAVTYFYHLSRCELGFIKYSETQTEISCLEGEHDVQCQLSSIWLQMF